MKFTLALILSLVLLVGCGNDQPAPGTPGAPGGSQPPATGTQNPSGSQWSAEEWSQTTNRCADAGAQYQAQRGARDKWLNYCACVYGAVATRYTLQQFRDQYNAIFSSLVSDGTENRCATSAGLQAASASAR